jgi:hypothetical protein
VVVEHGTVPDPELFEAVVGCSVNLGEIDVRDLLARRPQSARHKPAGSSSCTAWEMPSRAAISTQRFSIRFACAVDLTDR